MLFGILAQVINEDRYYMVTLHHGNEDREKFQMEYRPFNGNNNTLRYSKKLHSSWKLVAVMSNNFKSRALGRQ
jgi:hypothetical protein